MTQPEKPEVARASGFARRTATSPVGKAERALNELTDGTVCSVEAVMGAEIGQYRESRSEECRPGRRRLLVLGLTLFLGLLSWSAEAGATRYVSPAGVDILPGPPKPKIPNRCLSAIFPCRTVGHAIGIAGAGDTIQLAPGTYAEHLIIDKDLTLLGAGPDKTFIDGSMTGRVLLVTAAASVTIGSAGTASTGLTIQHGMTSNAQASGTDGAGILNLGTLTLNHSLVTLNTAGVLVGNPEEVTVTSCGGGIASHGTLTLNRSVVSSNQALASSSFGGRGGGVCLARDGFMVMYWSTVSGNTARQDFANGHASAGGGIYAAGILFVYASTISGNSADEGGGFYMGDVIYEGADFPGATLVLDTSTVSGNQLSGFSNLSGSGITFQAGNSGGSLTLVNSTIASNIGGNSGIFFDPLIFRAVGNTIVANNGGANCDTTAAFGFGGTVFLGRNLSSDNTCSDSLLFALDPQKISGSNLDNTDPQLAPLGHYGGPTQTHKLLPGSPAIDAAADPAACMGVVINGPATLDQRGYPRPAGPACDIGAFELEARFSFAGFFAPADNPPHPQHGQGGQRCAREVQSGGQRGLANPGGGLSEGTGRAVHAWCSH